VLRRWRLLLGHLELREVKVSLVCGGVLRGRLQGFEGDRIAEGWAFDAEVPVYLKRGPFLDEGRVFALNQVLLEELRLLNGALLIYDGVFNLLRADKPVLYLAGVLLEGRLPGVVGLMRVGE